MIELCDHLKLCFVIILIPTMINVAIFVLIYGMLTCIRGVVLLRVTVLVM